MKRVVLLVRQAEIDLDEILTWLRNRLGGTGRMECVPLARPVPEWQGEGDSLGRPFQRDFWKDRAPLKSWLSC